MQVSFSSRRVTMAPVRFSSQVRFGAGDHFRQALDLAAQLHATQTRKATNIPYLSHLLSVSALVQKFGGDEDEAIAALLHDAVEDQGGAPTLAGIRQQFGDRVADIVVACSDTDVIPKPPWRERKEAYIRHIAQASASARLVSAADKLDNCRDLLADYQQHGEGLWSRFNAPGGKTDVLWYYRALTTAFQQTDPHHPLVEELAYTVSRLERLANGKAFDRIG